MAKKWQHRRDDAGSMLATVVVIVGGAGLCGFVAAVDGTERSSWMLFLVAAVAFTLISWIIWYRYFRNQGGSLTFWHALGKSSRDDGLADNYRPRKVPDGRSNVPGRNVPITAQEAHEIQVNSANTWVPSRNKEGGKS